MESVVKKNDLITLDITGYTSVGFGVGRHQGLAVFVQGAAEGDTAVVRIVKLEKNFAYGKLEQLLVASPHRIESDCPVFEQCGGCVYRHITYEHELEIKHRMVADAMRKIAKMEIEVLPVIGCSQMRYRNKAQYPVSEGKPVNIGFYGPNSHRIVDVRDCRLQPKVFETILQVFEDFIRRTALPIYNEQTETGILRHIYIRRGERTGQLLVTAVVTEGYIPEASLLVSMLKEMLGEALCGVLLNVNPKRTNVILGRKIITLYGRDFITDKLCGLEFKISPLSFFQVNTQQAEKLYTLAGECAGLTGSETVLDLYCGTGTIGLTMAKQAARLIGVELETQAVADAKENAARNNITNAEFYAGDATLPGSLPALEGLMPDVLILDPPRKGVSVDSILSVCHPPRIVYISCDPATLARDLAAFAAEGYKIGSIQPVDMFPRTSHIECVVGLTRTSL